MLDFLAVILGIAFFIGITIGINYLISFFGRATNTTFVDQYGHKIEPYKTKKEREDLEDIKTIHFQIEKLRDVFRKFDLFEYYTLDDITNLIGYGFYRTIMDVENSNYKQLLKNEISWAEFAANVKNVIQSSLEEINELKNELEEKLIA